MTLYDYAGAPIIEPRTKRQVSRERQPPKPEARLTRKNIEQARIRVTFACLITAVEKGDRQPPVRHLWFPEDNVNRYSLRFGNPPPDSERPKHLRGQQLVIDLGVIPPDVWDAVKVQRKHARRGHSEPTRMIDVISDPKIIGHVNKLQNKSLLPKA